MKSLIAILCFMLLPLSTFASNKVKECHQYDNVVLNMPGFINISEKETLFEDKFKSFEEHKESAEAASDAAMDLYETYRDNRRQIEVVLDQNDIILCYKAAENYWFLTAYSLLGQ